MSRPGRHEAQGSGEPEDGGSSRGSQHRHDRHDRHSSDVERGNDGSKERKVFGTGLAKGLAVTLRTMTRRAVTEHYPEAQPELPPRTRGVIGLFEENCTVCMLCARECPDWCIYIDSHKETVPPAAPGGRERSRNVLDRFAIDFALCMYCGICIEVCPFDALFWSPEFEYAETDIHELTHERDKLRAWMWTVPEPPALDEAAEDAKELATARRTADKLAAQERAEAPGGRGAQGGDGPGEGAS